MEKIIVALTVMLAGALQISVKQVLVGQSTKQVLQTINTSAIIHL